MHALSLPTWWIHLASVLEWGLAMLAIQRWAEQRADRAWSWLALAMLPAFVSAMCACTWHLFDNAAELKGLVVLQAGTTVGEMGLYRHLGRTASVEALAPALVWRLTRERLALLELQEPGVAIALHRLVVRLLANRLDHANAQASAMAASDADPGRA